jgi:hypothetical protein
MLHELATLLGLCKHWQPVHTQTSVCAVHSLRFFMHYLLASIVHFLTTGSWCVLGFVMDLGRYLVVIMAKPAHSLTIIFP